MDGLELVSFKIISAVGMAKSSFIEAMKVAANGEFDAARAKIKEGEESFNGGHLAHSELIQQEASGNHVVPSILSMQELENLQSVRKLNRQSIMVLILRTHHESILNIYYGQ